MTAARRLLAVAATAVMFAAADTYVVVLALPQMMAGVGLSLDDLQRATPIVSGFLLGYVAVLPLVGRVADLRGRVPVLSGCLLLFAAGSLVTASAPDLASMVAGRVLQGVGGGGLVPATLALVADLYPAPRRAVPLGVVGGVQELGSVLGPLYGAAVLAVSGWRAIFWVNLVVALLLVAALGVRARQLDRAALVLAGSGLLAVALVLRPPHAWAADVTWGLAFVPVAGSARWLSPVGLAAVGLLSGWALVAARRWREPARLVDVPGGLLLGACLGGIVLAFATADPEQAVLSARGPWLLAGSALALGSFAWRQRVAATPLLPRGALSARPAWTAVAASGLVGAGLITALVDVPIFARVTAYPDSQLGAALVLLRLLVALAAGAVLGGYLTRRYPQAWVASLGLLAAAAGLALMSGWDQHALRSPAATVALVLGGLGFGLAVAPLNAALLAATADSIHGLASALLVVARMSGMLVGLSLLTTIGLRLHYRRLDALPAPAEVCGAREACPAYTDLVREAGLTQLQVVFGGGAVCALLAAAVAAWGLRPPSGSMRR